MELLKRVTVIMKDGKVEDLHGKYAPADPECRSHSLTELQAMKSVVS
jgi:hypothetical protein